MLFFFFFNMDFLRADAAILQIRVADGQFKYMTSHITFKDS